MSARSSAVVESITRGVGSEKAEMLAPRGHLALPAAVDDGQLLLEVVDPFLHEPAVHLELLLARATHADPHLEP